MAFIDDDGSGEIRERAALASGRNWPTFTSLGAAQWWLEMHCRPAA